MRILHVITDLRMGGAERVLSDLAVQSRQAGHRVDVVALKAVGQAARTMQEAGISCTALGAPDRPGPGLIPAVAKLSALLRSRPVDVVHAWLASGCAAVQLAAPPSLPRVFAAHVTDAPSYALCRLLAAPLGAPVRWLGVSHAVARAWAAALHVPVDAFTVIPNGIPAGPEPVPEPPGARAVFLGRLAHQKGLDVLLHALVTARIPVDIYGQGSDEAALRALAQRLGVAELAHFRGPTAVPAQVLRDASLLVLPSRAEGMPMVVLEAMAAGRAVVATRVGGTDEVVAEGQTGLLVPPEDPDALATALQRLQSAPEQRARLGRAGRERLVREFRLEQGVEATLQLYRATAARTPPRRSAR